MAKPEIIQVANLPPANPSYSQATRVGNVVYVAGQIGIDGSKQLVSSDVAAQTRQALENMRAILETAGSSLDRVAKTTIYMVDMNDWGAMNEVYMSYFRENPPAKTTVEVSRLALGALVEIEAIAAI